MSLKRRYYLIKGRLHVKHQYFVEKVLLLLAKWDLVLVHRVNRTNLIDQSLPTPLPDICSDRFEFSASYILRKIEVVSEYWFETKKHKRIFTMWENRFHESQIDVRAELKAFYAHFSPKHRQWVYRHSPHVLFMDDPRMNILCDLSEDSPTSMHEIKSVTLDFSKCRYGFSTNIADVSTHPLGEVVSMTCDALKTGLMSKVSEINKTLTGADSDGELMSPFNTPLCDNLLCRRCGLPVFASKDGVYKYHCMSHGELDYSQVSKVDTSLYKEALDNTIDILIDLVKASECP